MAIEIVDFPVTYRDFPVRKLSVYQRVYKALLIPTGDEHPACPAGNHLRTSGTDPLWFIKWFIVIMAIGKSILMHWYTFFVFFSQNFCWWNHAKSIQFQHFPTICVGEIMLNPLDVSCVCDAAIHSWKAIAIQHAKLHGFPCPPASRSQRSLGTLHLGFLDGFWRDLTNNNGLMGYVICMHVFMCIYI